MDRARKLPVFASAGVAHAWLVDPDAQTLQVLQLDHGRWTLLATFDGDAKVRAVPFDAIELDLATLWAR